MSRSRLEKSFVFKRFYEDLSDRYGDKKASAIWTYAQKELQRLEEADPAADDCCDYRLKDSRKRKII